MNRFTLELEGAPRDRTAAQLLAALAWLGEGEELAARLTERDEALESLLDEQGCEHEECRDQGGRCVLLIRRKF